VRALFLCCALVLAAPAHAGLTEAELAGVAAAPPPVGTRLPDLGLVDQDGRRLRWQMVARGRPVVLLFADYRCRHLCGPGLTLTAGALHDAGLAPGQDYRLATIALDPGEGPSDARAMRDTHLRALPAEAAAAVLFVADAPTIAAATRTLGYRFARDAASGQYAHDAVAYVFRADGGLSTTLPETGTAAPVMRAAIEAAARDASPPSPIASVATLCFGLGAVHGRYGAAIVATLRAGALALIATAVALLLLARRRRARPC
jgi:protein SCO1/2